MPVCVCILVFVNAIVSQKKKKQSTLESVAQAHTLHISIKNVYTAVSAPYMKWPIQHC